MLYKDLSYLLAGWFNFLWESYKFTYVDNFVVGYWVLKTSYLYYAIFGVFFTSNLSDFEIILFLDTSLLIGLVLLLDAVSYHGWVLTDNEQNE